MTKKRTALLSLATIIAMVMMLTFALPALADDPPATGSTGTELNPAKAAATKILKMPIGTVTPNIDFTFEFEKVSLDTHNDTTSINKMPTVAPVSTNSFSTSGIGITNVGNIKRVVQEVEIFAGVNWPEAGIYAYHVTEKQMSAYSPARLDTFLEKWEYSPAKYLVTVFVENKADGSGVYVKTITAKVITAETDGAAAGTKVDPTPKDPGTTGDYSKLIFSNTYLKNNGGKDPDDPKAAAVMALDKVVSGDYGSHSQNFPFTVKVSHPEVGKLPTDPYRAYLVNSSGVVMSDFTANAVSGTIKTDGKGNKYIEFPAGANVNVSLKHGEKLIFTDLPVGAVYDVLETGTPDYAPTYAVKTHPTNAPISDNAGDGASLAIPSTPLTDNGLTNTVTYNNRFTVTIADTGISVENLPYIVLIAVMLLSLVSFIVVKTRRNAKYYA